MQRAKCIIFIMYNVYHAIVCTCVHIMYVLNPLLVCRCLNVSICLYVNNKSV